MQLTLNSFDSKDTASVYRVMPMILKGKKTSSSFRDLKKTSSVQTHKHAQILWDLKDPYVGALRRQKVGFHLPVGNPASIFFFLLTREALT